MEKRLQRKLAGPRTHPVWRALSERLEELLRAHVAGAKDSVTYRPQRRNRGARVHRTLVQRSQGALKA